MADGFNIRHSYLHSQQSYAKNPLFQQGATRVTQPTDPGDNPDGGMQARSNIEADRRAEDALAPFLESLRLAQGDPMYRAISAQVDNLYQVFKQLHEQDQHEIRSLMVALDSQKQQLIHLAAENDSVRQQLLSREKDLAAATVAAAAMSQFTREPLLAPPAATSALVTGSAGSRSDLAAAGRSVRIQAGLNQIQPDEQPGESADAAAAAPRGPGAPVATQRGSRAALERCSAGIAGGRSGSVEHGRSASVSRRSRRPYLVFFLPYMLHPAHHCWRFYAAWQYSWTTRRTLWLAMAWVLVFLLAVGLLVGLLVPWDRVGRTRFSVSPEVVAVGPSYVSMVVQLNRAAVVYYAVLPEAFTNAGQSGRRRLASAKRAHSSVATSGKDLNGSGRRFGPDRRANVWQRAMAWWLLAHGAYRYRRELGSEPPLRLDEVEGDDLRDIAYGDAGSDAALFPFTVACGVVEVNLKGTNYTLTIRNGVPSPAAGGDDDEARVLVDECARSFGLELNGTSPEHPKGPFYKRRCQRCAMLQPGTPYVALLMGDGGRRTGVVRVRFITSAASPLPETG